MNKNIVANEINNNCRLEQAFRGNACMENLILGSSRSENSVNTILIFL